MVSKLFLFNGFSFVYAVNRVYAVVSSRFGETPYNGFSVHCTKYRYTGSSIAIEIWIRVWKIAETNSNNKNALEAAHALPTRDRWSHVTHVLHVTHLLATGAASYFMNHDKPREWNILNKVNVNDPGFLSFSILLNRKIQNTSYIYCAYINWCGQ